MADISKIKTIDGTTYNIKDPVSYNKVISRGEQLVVNGSGMLGDNTNFSSWTFDGSQANSSAGSFTRTGGYANIGTNEFFPVDASKKYRFEFDLKSSSNAGTMYAMLLFYDVDKYSISAGDHMYYSGTLTTLTQDLKAGDTVVHLADVSNYKTYGTSSHQRALKFWDYRNTFGYLYPPETYSRNTLWSAWTDDNSINKTNNTITLATAYTGATKPAGTYVSQGNSGGTYKYSGISGSKVPTAWTHYVGYFNGVDYSGKNLYEEFPPATAYAKVGFLWNYNSASDQFWATNISVKEVPVAVNAVDYGGNDTGLGNSTPSATAKTYYLDESKVTRLRPKVFYNTSGAEYTTFFSKGGTAGQYGSILKWGYSDRYLRILRRSNGSWLTEDWEKTDAGYADAAGYADSLTCHVVSGADAVNAFRGSRFRTGRVTSYSSAGLASNDGMIVWIPYSDAYGQQLLFDDTARLIKTRCYNNGTWGDWSANLADINAQLNSLSTGSSTPVDADYYISQYVNGGTTTTTYHRRPMSALWEYVKGKISSVLGLTNTNYGGTSAKATADASGNTITSYYAPKSTAVTNVALSTNKITKTINGSTTDVVTAATTSVYGITKLSTSTSSTATGLAATPSAVKTAYDLANTANGTANSALSGVNGNLIYDHTFTISNGVATFTPHVYQKGSEVTTNYAKSCFTWKYRLINGSEVTLTTKNDRGCDVTITNLGYGGHVIGTFTPPS